MTAIETFTDAIRWWGFLAGFLGIVDFKRRIEAWRAWHEIVSPGIIWTWAAPITSASFHLSSWKNYHEADSRILHPGVDVWAKFWVCLFLFGAGLMIPLFSRLGISDQWQDIIMASLWPSLSVAGWIYVASRAPHIRIMAGVAAGALALTMLASWATAHA